MWPVRGALLYMAHIIKKWSVTNVVITSAYNGAIIRWCWETRQTRLYVCSYGDGQKSFLCSPFFSFLAHFYFSFFFFIKVCRWKGWHRKLPWPGVRHSMSINWRMDNPPELFLTPNKLPSAIIIIIISRQFNDDCSSYTAGVDVCGWFLFQFHLSAIHRLISSLPLSSSSSSLSLERL